VRVIAPGGPRTGWLVWAHGGSWHSGSAQAWHHACADLAAIAGVTVVGVDYRLAPQHRHPAALHDIVAVLAWAQQQAAGEGGQVAVGGDSAGGTIAACAALLMRDRGHALAAQVLAYPPTDPQCRADSYHRDASAFPHADALRAAWRSYRGVRPPESSSLYSTPLEASDLTGLAPAIMGVGDLDPVIDDVRDYRKRLLDAGVRVRYQEFPATAHAAFLAPASWLREWLGSTLAAVLSLPLQQGTAS